MGVWLQSLGSVAIVSVISLIGILALMLGEKSLKRLIIYLVSFAAGALLGNAFLHLIPEVVEEAGGFTTGLALWLLFGIIFSFIIEKIIQWRHCHLPLSEDHVHPFAWMNLYGDLAHNFIDGIIIAVSYLSSVPLGIATTVAVLLHEIPQEISDFGVLLHGGFSVSRAIMMNVLVALAAIIGAVVALLASSAMEGITVKLIPFAAGGFIYIAAADLIPELHKEVEASKSFLQLLAFVGGVGVMLALLQF